MESTWELIRSIGKGSFAEVFQARNIFNGEHVAIKVSHGSEFPLVREKEVFQAIKIANCDHICDIAGRLPSLVAYKRLVNSPLEYIAMELLLGEDMSVVRDRSRKALIRNMPDKASEESSHNPSLKSDSHPPLPLAGVALLALEMLRCIRALHTIGFVHRDIKPANFVRRHCSLTTPDDLRFCLLDFGVSKRLPNECNRERGAEGGVTSRDGDKSVQGFRGTTMYASVSAHEQAQQGTKDDLWSLLFVFVDLLVGQLPWLWTWWLVNCPGLVL